MRSASGAVMNGPNSIAKRAAAVGLLGAGPAFGRAPLGASAPGALSAGAAGLGDAETAGDGRSEAGGIVAGPRLIAVTGDSGTGLSAGAGGVVRGGGLASAGAGVAAGISRRRRRVSLGPRPPPHPPRPPPPSPPHAPGQRRPSAPRPEPPGLPGAGRRRCVERDRLGLHLQPGLGRGVRRAQVRRRDGGGLPCRCLGARPAVHEIAHEPAYALEAILARIDDRLLAVVVRVV